MPVPAAPPRRRRAGGRRSPAVRPARSASGGRLAAARVRVQARTPNQRADHPGRPAPPPPAISSLGDASPVTGAGSARCSVIGPNAREPLDGHGVIPFGERPPTAQRFASSEKVPAREASPPEWGYAVTGAARRRYSRMPLCDIGAPPVEVNEGMTTLSAERRPYDDTCARSPPVCHDTPPCAAVCGPTHRRPERPAIRVRLEPMVRDERQRRGVERHDGGVSRHLEP